MGKHIAVVSLGLLLTSGASADIIVEYKFPGSTFAPTTVAFDVAATPVNATGSLAGIQPGAVLPDSIFLGMLIGSPTPAAAVANNQFFQFSVTPNPGFELDLTNLTFDAGRGGASVPRGWVLRSSLDGFAADIATADIPTVQPTLTPFSIDLTGSAFQNITPATTFRIYGYAPAVAGVGLFFDNLTLNGQVAPTVVVPEPSTPVLSLMGVALLGTAVRRKAKSRRTAAA